MGGTIDLEGAAELIKKLDALPDKIADRALSGGLTAGARVGRNEVRKVAPILKLENVRGAGTHEPGLLLRSINARKVKKDNKNQLRSGIIMLGAAFYWYWQEFGSSHQPARPFIRPAIESAKERMAQGVIDYTRQRVDKIAAES